MHLHLDLVSGIAGDMTVAALMDLGVPLSVVQEGLEALPVEGYTLSTHTEDVGMAVTARRFVVALDNEEEHSHEHEHAHKSEHSHEHVHEPGHSHEHKHTSAHHHSHEHESGHSHEHSHDSSHDHGHEHDHGHSHEHHSSWAQIREMLNQAAIKPRVREISLAIFEKIAIAEARVHGMSVEDIAFHEVGAVDSIVDIVAVAICLDHLGVTTVSSSPVPLGHGFTWSMHGRIPIPAPATLMILKGIPVRSSGVEKELVTPTGAGIIAALVESFSEAPTMIPEAVGHGGGTRRLPDRPNVVRAILGKPLGEKLEGLVQSTDLVIEANIDDMSGELAAHVASMLMKEGALDVWWTPIWMKKGRPAQMLSVLCEENRLSSMVSTILSESTSLGVRYRRVDRLKSQREFVDVETPYGRVTIKVGKQGDAVKNVAPEFDSVQSVANAAGVPVKEVLAAAVAASRDLL